MHTPQIIAYHILDGIASARRIMALINSLDDKNWSGLSEDNVQTDQLDELLKWIRTPHTDTLTTLTANWLRVLQLALTSYNI